MENSEENTGKPEKKPFGMVIVENLSGILLCYSGFTGCRPFEACRNALRPVFA